MDSYMSLSLLYTLSYPGSAVEAREQHSAGGPLYTCLELPFLKSSILSKMFLATLENMKFLGKAEPENILNSQHLEKHTGMTY